MLATESSEPPAPPVLPRLAAAILPVALAAGLGALATGPNVGGWYAGLDKPRFTPPDWAFPIAWTFLYAMMAAAAWRLLGARPRTRSGRRARRRALGAFLAQLALNAAWSPVFFAAHAVGAALVVVAALLAAVLWTIRLTWALDRPAAWLLAPYAAWTGFAALLNAAIWVMN